MGIVLRKGTAADAGLIINYLKKLAEYEKLSNECNITHKALVKLMNEENGLNVIIAEQDGKSAGIMAWYMYKIATFSGKRVFYIEDVYIDEDKRGCGIGSSLFEKAKLLAKENNCARLEWKCLDWNTSARDFYEKTGGVVSKDEWLTYTIDLN